MTQKWMFPMAVLMMGSIFFVEGGGGHLFAADSPSNEGSGVGARIEATAKKVGKKIEDGITKTVKKVEDKHIGDKIERKLKKAANKTAEGFEKAGKKIEQKFGN